jgi:pheromone shutdown protein TraB
LRDILHIDYNQHIELIGTAHFTRRSINDANETIGATKPTDIALELDMKRYLNLNAHCVGCSKSTLCKGLCEFTGAADALGNVDASIWLIDMTENEMKQRMQRGVSRFRRPKIIGTIVNYPLEDPVRLWEMGYKEEVIDYSEKQMEALRRISPSIPRVLIDERNALMASRLAWIASRKTNIEQSKIIAFVGAAHVKGIKELLRKPLLITDRFIQFGLFFSEPTLIRRVAIQEA